MAPDHYKYPPLSDGPRSTNLRATPSSSSSGGGWAVGRAPSDPVRHGCRHRTHTPSTLPRLAPRRQLAGSRALRAAAAAPPDPEPLPTKRTHPAGPCRMPWALAGPPRRRSCHLLTRLGTNRAGSLDILHGIGLTVPWSTIECGTARD